MHDIQTKLLLLAVEHDIANMRLADIARLLEISSLERVKHHRNQLIKLGLLKPDQKATKVERNVLGKSDLVTIPVLGSVNAGPASIYADAKVEAYLRISSSLLPKSFNKARLFALKVVGDSMNKANVNGAHTIEDGDYIVASASTFSPRNGDYVISLLDGKANVKRFFRDSSNGQVVLFSESTSDYPPIFVGEEDSLDYLAQAKVLSVAKMPKLVTVDY
jgi:SOS-response transcriptional repressor LexA